MVAFPLASVFTEVLPKNVLPSPKLDPSQVGFEKNSMRNCLLGLLLSVPWKLVFPPELITEFKLHDAPSAGVQRPQLMLKLNFDTPVIQKLDGRLDEYVADPVTRRQRATSLTTKRKRFFHNRASESA